MVLSLKPVGSACNMACSYCYYLEKGAGRMSAATLEGAIRQYAEAMPPDAPLQFLWHGGEPMLMPIGFYREAMEIERQVACGRTISNSLQTNATLITPQWAEFFKAEQWLLGVSIDGPTRFNDHNRRFADGTPSSARVLEAIAILNSHGVDWNVMATVNSANAAHPAEFYNFLKSLGSPYLQFSPIVERRTASGRLAQADGEGSLTPESVTPQQWGKFLCGVFDEWIKADFGRFFVQIFESTVAGKLGVNPGVCIFAPECGRAPVVDSNGDVYCCDHFVFDGFRLGNIHDTPLTEMLVSGQMARFGQMKSADLPRACRGCRFLQLCHGECPKNRIGANGARNYLCAGYQMYFRHVDSFMERIKRVLTSANR